MFLMIIIYGLIFLYQNLERRFVFRHYLENLYILSIHQEMLLLLEN